jgi:putative SOS response-associated peptidase YedK
MCGRYRIKDTDVLTEHLRRTFGIPDWVTAPRYNIAPSQDLPVLTMGGDGRAQVTTMRWGFVPAWEKSEKPRLAPINARSEEAFDKGMFRQSVQRRRCLLPADGFYEWKRLPDGRTKFPFDIHLKGGRPFFMAGIYESATGQRPETCLVFTTGPNAVMAPIHDRMPVILDDEAAGRWLAEGALTREQFAGFTIPHSASDMEAVQISPLVNSPRNNGPEVLLPATDFPPPPIRKTDLQGELF